MRVKVKKLHHNAVIPRYATEGAACFDLHTINDEVIYPFNTALIRTGLAFEIPEGYEMQIRPRSGLSATTSLRLANSPGTIDSDYRGEVILIMHNVNPQNCTTIKKGDRIAQALITPIYRAEFEEVEELSETERGDGGFGSTGK